MTDFHVITIDIGTQSVRVALFNQRGEVEGFEKETYEPAYFSPQPNFAEQDPRYYFDCIAKCAKRLARRFKEETANAKGITMSCFRDSPVFLDENYEVVRPTIVWLDQRLAECKEPLPAFSRFLFRLVGKTDTIVSNRRRCPSNWLKENEPENWARIKKYVPVSTYINYRLTGRLADSSSNMSGHFPIDFKKGGWYKNPEKHLTGQIFSLTSDMLAEIVPEGSPIGHLTKEASELLGLPESLILYACGSDKSCETLGLGVISPDKAAFSYGTASTVETTKTTYTESEPFLPAFKACVPGYYNMDIQIYRGYWMVNWFLKEFAGKKVDDLVSHELSAADLEEYLKKAPAGCNGLVLQPYWGPGLARPLAKGAIIGWSDATGREHMYRAIIEGICYALREGTEHFEKKNRCPIKEIRVSGGGAQSDTICQITADIMGRPVVRVQTTETGSLGAAIAGFLASGVYKNVEEALNAMVRVKDTFLPDPETHETYDYLYNEVYEKLYPSLDKSYKAIKKLNEKETKRRLALRREQSK